jgi:hypothetical protein
LRKIRREAKKLIGNQIYSNRVFHHADAYQQVQHMVATLRNAIERFQIVNEREICEL